MSVGIGERIRALRTERGLSQEEVARRTGVSLGSYGDIERGVTTDPHYSTLSAIAGALDTTVAELLVGEEQASQEWARHQDARLHGMPAEEWDDHIRSHDSVEGVTETWKEIYGEAGKLRAALSRHKRQRPQDRGRRQTLARGLRDLRMRRYRDLSIAASMLHARDLVDEIFEATEEEAKANA
jgi:transcriptional regulator with XRE-family HTH domain